MQSQKQANQVRGNKIVCINYQMCPICYGCRAYNSEDEDCLICEQEGKGANRNFNVCNTKIHEAWKINKLISKTKIELDKNTIIQSNGDE